MKFLFTYVKKASYETLIEAENEEQAREKFEANDCDEGLELEVMGECVVKVEECEDDFELPAEEDEVEAEEKAE